MRTSSREIQGDLVSMSQVILIKNPIKRPQLPVTKSQEKTQQNDA